jgi:hypothetical protein
MQLSTSRWHSSRKGYHTALSRVLLGVLIFASLSLIYVILSSMASDQFAGPTNFAPKQSLAELFRH